MPIRLFIFSIGVLFALFTLELVRRKVLRPKYALLWAAVSLSTFAVALFPGLIVLLMKVTSMTYQSSVIMLIFIFSALLFMNFSVIASRHGERIVRLTQEIALLRHDVGEIREALQNDPSRPRTAPGSAGESSVPDGETS